MQGMKQLWKKVSGDLGKIHGIVQLVHNWKVGALCTVGLSVFSWVATAASCAFIAKAQWQRAEGAAAIQAAAAAAAVQAEEAAAAAAVAAVQAEEAAAAAEAVQVAEEASQAPPSPPPVMVVVVVLLS
ncbi:hypothetical protein L3X38_016325 [Prunus dulcis]|uniref:Uncharacterized protein n=1 Tax=Prunus dulcis TaxID=3755 RepID=A0AAD4Z910_PRUDU|nr:hypothetical protein L3X38_016325 [Prunus dulcis]